MKATNLEMMIEEKPATAKTVDIKALGLRLWCKGDVTIEANAITAKAAELQYDAEKDLLMLSTCTLWSRSSNGTTSLSKAEKMILRLQTGDIEMRNEHH